MAKKEKEKPLLKIDDDEYDIESMSDAQKAMVNHISDLDRKVSASEFNLIQLRFGRQAFIDAIRASLSESKDSSSES
jgi:hypothetical protein|tara:strand:+ start:22 stop:252 length:231 start_codon:yes stop_codon:yes gene_type:complete